MIVFGVLLCLFSIVLCIVCIKLSNCTKKRDVAEVDIEKRLMLMRILPCLVITIIVIVLLMAQLNWSNLFGSGPLNVQSIFISVNILFLLAYCASFTVRKIARLIYTDSIINSLDNFCLFLRPFHTDRRRLTVERKVCKVAKNLYPLFAVTPKFGCRVFDIFIYL